jgi:hypothetical protein
VTSTRRPKSAFMRKAIALIGNVVRDEIGQNLGKMPRYLKDRQAATRRAR